MALAIVSLAKQPLVPIK